MHDTDTLTETSGDLEIDIAGLTRVEGEGSLRLQVRNGVVEKAHLEIFEAPRYFEQLVVGRTPDEVIDIVARICGICPVAYQMTAVHAFEHGLGIAIDPAVRALRRLLYCGEWIESHALHVYLLHLPDFLGYASALEMAHDHRAAVEAGLSLKKTGNRIVELIGGRAIHPVSVRVGGFSRTFRRTEIRALRESITAAIEIAHATVDLVAGLETPEFVRDGRLVALRHPDEYPMNEGRIVSNDGLDLAATDWRSAFGEQQVAWSNALQSRGRDGRPYLLGPMARITVAGKWLHPTAAVALARTGLAREIAVNPYRSIVARAVELVDATAEALDIIEAYEPPDAAATAWRPGPAAAAWATEAPRGLIFHAYELDERGLVAHAQIVPPTSQNQAAIEADLAAFAPRVLGLPNHAATHRIEQLIRSYDPCISCATHFLDLSVENLS
ncbi:MAG TPA: nickel-dependent hydrogenase large subunit [Candidatus Limnocylindrales bacterium]|nr:nickel-dependent hydrogenase large subunit [Candidatus Limnocylindrales bacterium]